MPPNQKISTTEYKIPKEVWTRKPVDYSRLKVVGCPAYVNVSDGKLEPQAKKCIFLGYVQGVTGNRLCCTGERSFGYVLSRNITFDKSLMLHSDTG